MNIPLPGKRWWTPVTEVGKAFLAQFGDWAGCPQRSFPIL